MPEKDIIVLTYKEMFMEAMKELYDVVNNQLDYARKLKETSGKKVVGYMCTYAPEELINAAGAHPLRLFGSSKKFPGRRPSAILLLLPWFAESWKMRSVAT